MTGRQTASFIKQVALKPQKRIESIQRSVEERDFTRDETLQAYGIEVEVDRMVECSKRI